MGWDGWDQGPLAASSPKPSPPQEGATPGGPKSEEGAFRVPGGVGQAPAAPAVLTVPPQSQRGGRGQAGPQLTSHMAAAGAPAAKTKFAIYGMRGQAHLSAFAEKFSLKKKIIKK